MDSKGLKPQSTGGAGCCPSRQMLGICSHRAAKNRASRPASLMPNSQPRAVFEARDLYMRARTVCVVLALP